MLEEVLIHLNNWFEVSSATGTWSVQDNSLRSVGSAPVDLQENQYFRIEGSIFNDGLHRQGETLTNEQPFKGKVSLLAIPSSVISLAELIGYWREKNEEVTRSPLSSESFDGYSYSKAQDATTGGATTWQSAFRAELNKFRKVH